MIISFCIIGLVVHGFVGFGKDVGLAGVELALTPANNKVPVSGDHRPFKSGDEEFIASKISIVPSFSSDPKSYFSMVFWG